LNRNAKVRPNIVHKNAEMKRFHGMDIAKYRGLFRMRIQAYLTAFVVNVKRMVKLIEPRERTAFFLYLMLSQMTLNQLNYLLIFTGLIMRYCDGCCCNRFVARFVSCRVRDGIDARLLRTQAKGSGGCTEIDLNIAWIAVRLIARYGR
jgi:hypothetical protein